MGTKARRVPAARLGTEAPLLDKDGKPRPRAAGVVRTSGQSEILRGSQHSRRIDETGAIAKMGAANFWPPGTRFKSHIVANAVMLSQSGQRHAQVSLEKGGCDNSPLVKGGGGNAAWGLSWQSGSSYLSAAHPK